MWSSCSVRDIPTISKFFPGFVYNLSHPYPCVILYPLGVVRQKRPPPKLEVYKDDLRGRLCDEHLSPGGVFLVDMMIFFRLVGIGDYHKAADLTSIGPVEAHGVDIEEFCYNRIQTTPVTTLAVYLSEHQRKTRAVVTQLRRV